MGYVLGWLKYSYKYCFIKRGMMCWILVLKGKSEWMWNSGDTSCW